MSNFQQQLRNIGIYTGGFIACMILAGIFTKIDRTGGISMILVIGGALAYLYFVLKFVFRMFRRTTTAPVPAVSTTNYSGTVGGTPKPESTGSKLPIYFAFFVLLALLATSGGRPAHYMNPLMIHNSMGGWLWWMCLLCFIVGLGGKRITAPFKGRTYLGREVHGYIDFGAEAGTGGMTGAVALTLAYITVYMSWVMIAHWILHKNFPDDKDGTLVICIIVGAFLVLPLYFLLLSLINANNKRSWIILGTWAAILAIVARV